MTFFKNFFSFPSDVFPYGTRKPGKGSVHRIETLIETALVKLISIYRFAVERPAACDSVEGHCFSRQCDPPNEYIPRGSEKSMLFRANCISLVSPRD